MKVTKILLINPPYNRLLPKNELFDAPPSIGLAILQKLYLECGIECDILDLNYYLKDLRECTSYKSVVQRFIPVTEYSHIGITSFSNSFLNAVLIAREIKMLYSDITIYLGGAHVSSCTKDIVSSFQFVDFVCVGEGEKSVKYIVEYFKENIEKNEIPGIAYIENGKVIFTEELDLLKENELPHMPLELSIIGVDTKKLLGTSISIEGGRGCPFNCIFCATKNFWQRKNRMKPIQGLIEEMDALNQYTGITSFTITHDLFTVRKKFVIEFCEEVKKRGYTWSCSARLDTVDMSLLDKMYDSGCSGIFFGVETGSQEVQRIINKNLDLEKSNNIIMNCCDHKYGITLSFILGFPFETPSQLEETLKLMYKYYNFSNVTINTGILTPEIGTEIYEKYKSELEFDKSYALDSYDYVSIDRNKELDLMKQYPGIFSHFYYAKNDYFSIYSLKFIERAVCFLATNYYKTLGIALNNDGGIINVIQNIVKIPYNKFSKIDYDECTKRFDFKMQKYVQTNAEINSVYMYESALKKVKYEALKNGKASVTIETIKEFPKLEIEQILVAPVGQFTYQVHAERKEAYLNKVSVKIMEM